MTASLAVNWLSSRAESTNLVRSSASPVKSSRRASDYDCDHGESGDITSCRRSMAVEMYDAVLQGGVNIGQLLLDLGLVKQEVGEKVYIAGQKDYSYTKVEIMGAKLC